MQSRMQLNLSLQDIGRRWDAIRAGWPTLLIPFFASVLVALTGQGQEVLYAMTLWPFYWFALLAFVLTGLILHLRFIAAIDEHYPFSAHALYSTAPVPWAALFAGCSMPATFSLFYLLQAMRLGPRGLGLEAGWSPGIGFFVCLTAIAVLALWHVLASRWLLRPVQTHASRFLIWDRRLRRGEWALVVALFIFALAIWWFPRLASDLGPVPVFAVSMTVWSIVLNLVVWFVARRDWMPSPVLAGLAIIILLAFLVPMLGRRHYAVATIPCAREAVCGTTARASAVEHARAWIAQRSSGADPVTAIVVIADGGGIRAALETAAVLAELDQSTGGRFYDHVYALSGVSGGAIGIATYLAARASRVASRNWSRMPSDVERELEADHFSPLLAGLLLRDIPDLLVPLSLFERVPDRARLFEQSLSENWKGGRFMAAPFGAAVDAASGGSAIVPPAVELDTTLANAGTVETVSNVEFSGYEGIESLCNVLDQLPKGETLSLATAAHLSARFPVTNPPGKIVVPPAAVAHGVCAHAEGTRLAYVDGAYADNTGAEAATHAVDALGVAARSLSDRHVRVVVIHIFATASDPESKEEIQRAGEADRVLDDLRVPIQAIGLVQYELGLAPLKQLCGRVVAINAGSGADAAQGDALCGGIGAAQSAGAGGAVALVGRLWQPRACLSWLNAALYVSPLSNHRDYVPLGWMLGPSKDYVAESSRDVARAIAGYLGPVLSGSSTGTDGACAASPAGQ